MTFQRELLQLKEKMGLTENKSRSIIVSNEEASLIEKLRLIAYGEVVIFIQKNKPIRIERIKESIML